MLVLAATIGVISPTGNEVGPFLAVEQAALSQTIPDARRTPTFAWYNLAGYVATAVGALAAGIISQVLLGAGLVAGRRLSRGRHRLRVVGLLMALRVLAGRRGRSRRPRVAADDGIRRRLGLGTVARDRRPGCRRCSRSTPSPAASSRRA